MKRITRPALLICISLLTLFTSSALSQARCGDQSGRSSKAAGILVVRGSITTTDGIPVPAQVSVYCRDEVKKGPIETVTADSRGRYELKLAVGPFDYRITASYPGLREADDWVQARAAGTFEHDYRLHVAVATLKGVVRDEQGHPVGGANVTLTLSQSPENTIGNDISFAHLIGTVRTNAKEDGSFFLTDLPAGHFSVTASHGSEYQCAPTDVDLQVGENHRDLVLSRVRELLMLRVSDTSDRPLNNLRAQVASAEGGTFSAGHLGVINLSVPASSPGPFQCLIGAEGYTSKEITVERDALFPPTVVLSPGIRLKGYVQDVTGRPIPDVEVALSSHWNTTVTAPEGPRHCRTGFSSSHSTTKKDGSFDLPIPALPSWSFEHILRLKLPGYVPRTRPLSEPDVQSGLHVTLESPAGTVSGRVLSADGTPLQSFEVRILRAGREPRPNAGPRVRRTMSAARLVTFGAFSDRNGRFFIQNLPEGELDVYVVSRIPGRPESGAAKITVVRGMPTPPLHIRLSPETEQ